MPASKTCEVQRLGIVDYDEALELQRRAVEACQVDGQARLLLLEHPHTYTLGARGDTGHLLADDQLLGELDATVRYTNRGGDITYHGPGQLVGYPILDIRRWRQGPRWYVRSLEQVVIDSLAAFGIRARREEGRPGVWANDAKIAAIGVRISRGITSHGFAMNVNPELDYFTHIVPCGLPDITVTSMARELGSVPPVSDVEDAVCVALGRVFGMALRERETALIG